MNRLVYNSFLRLTVYCFILFSTPILSAQENQVSRLFLDIKPDTFHAQIDTLTDSLKLPDYFLIPRSERIFRNSFRLFRGIHYQVENIKGIVFFNTSLQQGDSLSIYYQKYPFPLIPSYRHRELQAASPQDTTDESISAVYESKIWEEIDEMSSNLERSGSIIRGIEVGSNRDLTLNSGLNLQLSGYITPEVQVVAALTDESTPIQPEGNTQTLREVDKVFVKINSPKIGGTLGDFNLSYRNSSFGNLNRKLQGITTQGQLGNFHQQLTYATSRGIFHSNEFLGQEGNQGPYQLVGRNGEREILVLAGTERLYVNGELQIRGENNDYIIDYSLGQVTFTNNRLITGEDRIDVDFEYSNIFQRYGKNFLGFSSANKPAQGRFSYDVRLFREWDDTDNLLEDSAPLSEEEKAALALAGNDQFKASVSGADSVGPGNGNYVKSDTLIDGQEIEYFTFVGTGNGTYIVRFSSVGKGNGSYVRERLGVFRFVGPGAGEYLPVRLVPLAGDKKVADLGMNFQAGRHFTVRGEAAVSHYDRNVFSDIDDDRNLGKAFNVSTDYMNDRSSLFGQEVGLVNWHVKWRRQEMQFDPLDRQFNPEYSYKWNLSSFQSKTDENNIESVLFYQPVNFIQLNADAGWIELGENTSSRRFKGSLATIDSTRLRSRIQYELVQSTNPLQESDWTRAGGDVGRKFGRLFPYVEIGYQDRQVNQNHANLTGFQFKQGAAGLRMTDLLGLNWTLKSLVRDDFLYNPDDFGKLLKLSRAFTQHIAAQVGPGQNLQGRVSFVYRQKDYESFFERLPADSIPKFQPDPQFQDTSWIDRESYLGRIELRYRNTSRTVDSRWQYRVASELQALQEKVFLDVGENRGNYRFDENLQEYVPDPQGNFLLVVLPTGNFEPVTNIEASWQIRYRPKFSDEEYTGFQKIVRNISFFSLLKINEKSNESNIWQLYILNLSKFRNDLTTLRGRYTIDQDIYFFERNPDFGITLRSRFRDNLSNEFVDIGFNEKRKSWDRSVIWRQSLWRRKLTQELEYRQSILTRDVAAVQSRNRDIFGHILNAVYKYRPVYAWQFQLGLEGGLQNDRAPQNKLEVGYLEFRPQVNYAIAGKARAQFNVTLLSVNILDNPFSRPIPFELGKGKKEGISFSGNFRFEYFISSNITTTLNVTARKDAQFVKTIYQGQAEVRAFF